MRRALAGAACLLFASPLHAGSLSGPILDEGLQVEIEDVIELPISSGGSPPLARVNVLREAPDGSGRLFVCDLNGPLYVVDQGTVHTYMDFSTLFPDFKVSPGLASGLVSFALHPEFAENGRFYTVHSEYAGAIPPNLVSPGSATYSQHSILTEWTANDPSADVFSGTSRELIRIGAFHHVHNLGEIAFNPTATSADPDYGLLYIGGGDHGSVITGRPEELQRADSPLGAVLRIDPLGGPFIRGGITYPYGIPPGNPYASDPDPDVLGEIYANGFRNAHRIAWDLGLAYDSEPFVSDIGEDNLEEINVLRPGQRYGWPEREGTYAIDVDVDTTSVFALPPDDASRGFTYPSAQYDHEEGSAIAGGFVYRGDVTSPLYGKFVFGDVVSGRIFYTDAAALRAADDGDPLTTAAVYELHLVHNGQPSTLLGLVADKLGNPSQTRTDLRFAMDSGGQIYLTTKQDGYVRALPEPGGTIQLLSGLLFLAFVSLVSARVRAPRHSSRAWFRHS